MVRAKFRCTRVTRQATGRWHEGKWHSEETFEVAMEPVTGDSAENKEFFASTPYGDVKLGLVSAETQARFTPGRTYYVDFSPAE